MLFFLFLSGEERTKILQEMKEASDCANNEDKGKKSLDYEAKTASR